MIFLKCQCNSYTTRREDAPTAEVGKGAERAHPLSSVLFARVKITVRCTSTQPCRKDIADRAGSGRVGLIVLKNTAIRENVSLQFRAELFNCSTGRPRAFHRRVGVITSTSATSPQVQFGLKLLWLGDRVRADRNRAVQWQEPST